MYYEGQIHIEDISWCKSVECVSEGTGLTSFISDLKLCMTVVVRSAVTGPDSNWVLRYQHNGVPCRR